MTRSPLMTENTATHQQSGRIALPLNLIVLHHGATTSADQIVAMMVTGSRQVSAHAVVKDGRRIGVVDESARAWSLSDAVFDSRAFTTECANESTNGWTISAASHESLARLCADWSTRYGFPITRSGDPRGWTLLGHREVYTIHGRSYATACPGGMELDWVANQANQIKAGGGLVAPVPWIHQEEEQDMYIRARSTGPSGDAREGYVYRRTEGSWMAVTSLEGDTIVPALANDFHTLIPVYEGIDLELLFATDGLWEQLPLEGAPHSSIGPLLGLGARTGRRIYRGAPGPLGQWHYPHLLGTAQPAGV